MTESEIPFISTLKEEVRRTAFEQTRQRDAPSTSPGTRQPGGHRRTRRPLVAVTLIVIIAAGMTGVLLSGRGGSGLSIVAQASAATDNQGTILAYSYTSTGTLPAGNRPDPRETARVWSTTERSHAIVTESNLADTGRGRMRRITSSQEFTSTPTTQTTWYAAQVRAPANLAKGLIIESGATAATINCQGALSALGPDQDGACGTPISAIHQLLESRELHLTGRGTVDGQKVDVLTGSPDPPPHGPLVKQTWTVTIDVDVSTFAPVEVREHQVLSTRKPGATTTDTASATFTIRFGTFRHLPMTAANEELLAMRPHPGADVLACEPSFKCTTSKR